MTKTFYIHMHNNIFVLQDYEWQIPSAKIAAKVSLTDERVDEIMRLDWDEYQDILEHYFEHNQKLVTA